MPISSNPISGLPISGESTDQPRSPLKYDALKHPALMGGSMLISTNILLAAVAVTAPFVNVPGGAPDPKALFRIADTSQSTPKALYADAQLPIQNYQHTPPDRVRPVVDTSRGTTPEELSFPPNVSAQTQSAPQKFFQSYDTTQSTPKPLYGDAVAPIQNYQHTAPDRVRPVVDTSFSTNALLLTPTVTLPNVVAWTQSAPQRPLQSYDTNQNTPKVLYADLLAPFQNYQHTAPDRVRPVVDTSKGSVPEEQPFPPNVVAWTQSAPQKFFQSPETSQGTPKPLYADAQLPVQNYQHTPPDAVRPVVNTAAGTPTALLPAVFPIPPGLSTPQSAPIRFWWQPADTSASTPKPLYSDAQLPVQNYQHTQPDRTRPVADTSQSSLVLYAVVVPPVVNAPHFYPQRLWWQPADTSASTAKALYADAVAPFSNYQHTPPDRVRPVVDTTSTQPKTLYPDATTPTQNYQHTAPDRVRPVVDTSQSMPLGLATTPLPPIVPAPLYTVQRAIFQPADTSQSTGKVLYGDATTPFFNYQHTQPFPPAPVVDTSQSAPQNIPAPTPTSNAPSAQRRIREQLMGIPRQMSQTMARQRQKFIDYWLDDEDDDDDLLLM